MTSWTYSSVHSAMYFNIFNACITNCFSRETIYASLQGAKYTMIKCFIAEHSPSTMKKIDIHEFLTRTDRHKSNTDTDGQMYISCCHGHTDTHQSGVIDRHTYINCCHGETDIHLSYIQKNINC